MNKQARSMKIQLFLEPDIYFKLERALKENKERIEYAVKTDSEMIRYALIVATKHLEICSLNQERLKLISESKTALSDKYTALCIENEKNFKEKHLLGIQLKQLREKVKK
jgi:hypothetical protein